MIARAAALELDTPYKPPAEDPDSLHAAGFAKTLCSAVFVTGLDPKFAAENVGYFTGPPAHRANMSWRIDHDRREVHVTTADNVTRTARYLGDLGCAVLPPGAEHLRFDPPVIHSRLPDAATTPWPMGDLLPQEDETPGIDLAKVGNAVEAAFADPDGMTAAMVVTWHGKIIGERYGQGISMQTPLESWSMGKSVSATLLGILMEQGIYQLDRPAPIPQWQSAADPRREIRIADLLRMSSGLRFRAPMDPDFDAAVGYPDHLYVYTGSVNIFEWTAGHTQQWPPGQVGRYRNCDPVIVNYLIRLAVEDRGLDYHSFPTDALFDKIGIRNMVLETDSYGNFLAQGYDLAAARDWARLGNLYLQDGVWNGQRILPADFVDFVSTLAPAWLADGRPIYGGFFWINGDERFPIPKDAYFMAGAGGQYTILIPSHDLVVVRLGHYKGATVGLECFRQCLRQLMEVIPPSEVAN